jgi:hypothetical protein
MDSVKARKSGQWTSWFVAGTGIPSGVLQKVWHADRIVAELFRVNNPVLFLLRPCLAMVGAWVRGSDCEKNYYTYLRVIISNSIVGGLYIRP